MQPWTEEDVDKFIVAVNRYRTPMYSIRWKLVSAEMGRSVTSCQNKYKKINRIPSDVEVAVAPEPKPMVRRHRWDISEDHALMELGVSRFHSLRPDITPNACSKRLYKLQLCNKSII